LPKLKTHYYRENNKDIQDKLEKSLGRSHRITLGKVIPSDTQVLILAYPTAEKLASLIDLKYLIIPFVGLPQATSQLLKDYPHIKLLNIHHNARPVAENVMALLLTGIKHIIPADRDFRKHDWSIRYQANPSSLLYQKKLLICGYGHIGKLLESFLLPYEVIIDKIKRKDINPQAGIYSLDDLDSIVGNYDYIINLLPATEQTKAVFNKKTFEAMKTSSYFVNVGRASTVDEESLFTALEKRLIGGAALDVWYKYPVNPEERTFTQPANFPFHTLDNVIMSPHRAGGLGMSENEDFRVEALVSLLKKIETKPNLPGIDLKIGY
jgi:phosphoglycerate dehydrogenase-like enzyme